MKFIALAAVFTFTIVFPFETFAQPETSRLGDLERHVAQLERHPRGEDAAGAAAFVSAAV